MSRLFVVTGASGFIGRRLCAALRERGRVRALIRHEMTGPWDECIVADVAGDAMVSRAFDGADVVYHLAARAHALAERKSDISEYTRVNVDGTRRVADAARAAGVPRLVFASSVKAMGEGDGGAAMSPYGQSKRDAERIVLASGIVEPVVMRLALVYGPGVEGNLGGMLRAVRARRFPPPPRMHNKRTMVHVDDVVRVMIAAGDHARAAGRTFVVTDGVAYSTRGVYDAMLAALGRPAPAWSLPAPMWRVLALAGDALGAVMNRRAPFDSDAYRKLFASAWYAGTDLGAELGMAPSLTLEDALPDMVARR